MFTKEKLLADLIAKYAYLNDDNKTALEVYNKIIDNNKKH